MKHFTSVVAVFLGIVMSVHARAGSVQFALDSAQSQVTISGSFAGSPIQEQGPGSLTTSFSGALQVDFENATLQFLPSSLVQANTNGSWEPLPGGQTGSAPADFGAQAPVFLATVKGGARNIALNLSSPALALQNGQFSGSTILFSFPANSTATLDYNAGFLGSGSRSLAGTSTNQTANAGTLSTNGMTQVLHLQIQTTFSFKVISANDTVLTFTGNLVATRSLAPVFESITLSNGQIRLVVSGADSSYQLQGSSDLAHWTMEQATRATQGDQLVLTTSAAGPVRFYRLVKF